MKLSLLGILCILLGGFVLISNWNNLSLALWKKIFVIAVGLLSGVLGLKIMRYIEDGTFMGTSFFGAHFFGGLGIVHACLLVRTSLSEMTEMLDISAQALCASQVVSKINCYIDQCCYGIVLFTSDNGDLIRFPSQLVECAFSLFLFILFTYWLRRGKHRGTIWYLYMVFYGVGRFFLNLLRDTTPWILGMAAGNFWSMISIAIGLILLYIHHLRVVTAEEKKAATQNRRAHKAH